jgi:large subunit ribosomal protein L25
MNLVQKGPPVSTRPQLVAQRREVTGKKVAALRRAGQLPAVVYGHGHASEPIVVDAREFATLRRHAGRNALVDLTVGSGRATPVLLHDVQEHPISRVAVHADFFVVKMTEEMVVDVPIQTTGESPAVDKLGGNLLHMRDSVQVRALPADLPQSLVLDISALDDFEATLHVSDLQMPERVTLVTDAQEPLVRVQAPRVETEEAPSAAEGAEAGAPAGDEATGSAESGTEEA